jgi:hypothetical protein
MSIYINHILTYIHISIPAYIHTHIHIYLLLIGQKNLSNLYELESMAYYYEGRKEEALLSAQKV